MYDDVTCLLAIKLVPIGISDTSELTGMLRELASPETHSQKSVPWYTYYIKALCRRVFRNCAGQLRVRLCVGVCMMM